MEIKNVIGDSIPDRFEKLQGGTLINVQIEENVLEEVIKYKYKQMFTLETNNDRLERLAVNMEIYCAKQYLASTDYKMTVDYFATLTKEVQDELTTKRAESREFIRINTGVVK